MRTRTPLPLLWFALALSACSSDPATPTDDGGTGETDTSGGSGSDAGDAGSDASTDTATDGSAPDADDDAQDDADTGFDTADTQDGSGSTDVDDDAGDGSGPGDTVDEPDAPPGASSCGTTPDCDSPLACIEGYCRIPMVGRILTEDNFEIVEPEEIAGVFDLIKAFAVDVKFVVLDAEDTETTDAEVFVEYGAGDIIDRESDPIVLAWQELVREAPATFRPDNNDDGFIDPWVWRSDPFDFLLAANVEASFGAAGSISANVAFETIDVVLTIRFDPTTLAATAVLDGYATRLETEDRVLGTIDELSSFSPLLCSDRSYAPDDALWNLSDIFDCNAAPLDADLDGDTVPDAYHIVIDTTLVRALITSAP